MREPDMPGQNGAARIARRRAVPLRESPSNSECVSLLTRILERDPHALERLYNLTVGHVYGLALRITGRREPATQVTEDVFVRAWNEAISYHPGLGSPLQWLLALCRNRACEASQQADDIIANLVPSRLQDLLQAMHRSAPLQAAIEKLRPRQRLLLNLAFFRGMTYEQLATHTGLRVRTVSQLMRNTMATLREELTDAASPK
jgi:RNA polymerase sigma-70 factor (ECF subfamily)